jgi:hypothetical protein
MSQGKFPVAEKIAPCYRLPDGRLAVKVTQTGGINDPDAERYTDKESGKRVWLKPVPAAPSDAPVENETESV